MLTDIVIRRAKPRDKQYKLSDGGGLRLLISSKGTKSFYYRYRWNGKESTITIGKYPACSLANARNKRDEFALTLQHGNNPNDNFNQSKVFTDIANEWFDRKQNEWTTKTVSTNKKRLEYAVDALGSMQIDSITALDVLNVLRNIERRGAVETAKRVKSIISQIFRYAMILGHAKSDVTYGLSDALQKPKKTNHAFLRKPEEIKDLMFSIDNYSGSVGVQYALKLLAYTFVRSKEIRFARWDQIEGDIWRIPAENVKTKREHVVPLSKQALALLDTLRIFNEDDGYIFPSSYTKTKPISDNALLLALKRMDYGGRMTVHGFRHMASTQLNEQEFDGDAIEIQLCHSKGDVRSVYNKATKLEYRKKMMQHWSDWLDDLSQ
jgi:integrase